LLLLLLSFPTRRSSDLSRSLGPREHQGRLVRSGDVPRARLPVWLSLDPVAADRHVVTVVRVEGHRATDLPPVPPCGAARLMGLRSEEHTSELQSRVDLV